MKIKVNRKEFEENAKDIVNYLKKNELGLIYGGEGIYYKYSDYLNFIAYTLYTESTYVNYPLPPIK